MCDACDAPFVGEALTEYKATEYLLDLLNLAFLIETRLATMPSAVTPMSRENLIGALQNVTRAINRVTGEEL